MIGDIQIESNLDRLGDATLTFLIVAVLRTHSRRLSLGAGLGTTPPTKKHQIRFRWLEAVASMSLVVARTSNNGDMLVTDAGTGELIHNGVVAPEPIADLSALSV